MAAISVFLLISSPNLGVAQPCPDFVSKLKSGISALVGKSSERLQAKIEVVKKELNEVSQDYSALNDYMLSTGYISAAGRAGQVARIQLSQKLKQLYRLQKRRYSLEKKYFTTPMRDEYVGEVIGVERTNAFREMGVRIQYVDPSKRNVFRAAITRSGNLLDSQGMPLNGKMLFVMDQEGGIYAAPPGLQFSNGKFLRHSSFLAGEPAAAAGEMIVRNGKIILVNRKSGHYKPSQKANDQFLSQLQEQGVNISQIEIGSGL